MVCHMFWILTSDESIELVLDGINIPHGQYALILVLSQLIKEFNDLWLGSFIIDQRKLCITVVK